MWAVTCSLQSGPQGPGGIIRFGAGPPGDGIILGGVHRTDLVGLLLFHAPDYAEASTHPARHAGASKASAK
jgi:hypothetical protein